MLPFSLFHFSFFPRSSRADDVGIHRGLCSCPWTGVERGSALWAASNWSKFAPPQLTGGETWIDSVYQGRLTRAWEPPAGTLTGSKYLQMNRAVWLRCVYSETLPLVILPISCCCLMCYSSQDYRPQLASGFVRMIQTRKWKADEGTHLHHYCVQGVCRKHCVFKLLIETKYLICKILTNNHKLLPYFKYYIILLLYIQNLTCLCPSQVIHHYCKPGSS